MTASLALDGVVVALLVGLALRLLRTRDLFEAIVLFVAFGLTLSLAWVRVGAADLALAEAALGAGVTGALFLSAWRHLSARADFEDRPLLLDDGSADPPPLVRMALGAAAVAGAWGMGWFVLRMPPRAPILPELMVELGEASQMGNPVTAVLLNFRSWDTLLEMAVLVVALVAVRSMDRDAQVLVRGERHVDDPVPAALARVVVPLAGAVAVYLTWAGAYRIGGAFQAGALLAGAGVLLTAAGLLRPATASWTPVRAMAAAGVWMFLGAGLAMIPWTGTFLAWPRGVGYPVMVGIEAVLTLSIAVVLVALVVDVPAVPDPDPRLDTIDPTGDPLGRLFDPVQVLDDGEGTEDRQGPVDREPAQRGESTAREEGP